MDAFEAISTRKSVRAFLDRDIPDDIIAEILKAGTRAPSGGNRQPWRFIVVRDKDKIQHFDPYCKQPWVNNAPAVIVACADPFDTWNKYDEGDQCFVLDTAAAIQNMLLAIHALGLGAVWILSFSKREVRRQLNIPLHWQIISIIPFGYYKEDAPYSIGNNLFNNCEARPRRPLSEVAFMENVDNPIGE